MNRKHFVIYFEKEQLISTVPKDWARLHEDEFPKFNFENKMPTTDEISAHLIKNYGFTRIENEHRVITIQL